MNIGAADPTVRAEFAERLSIVARRIGGQTHGFTDGCQSATASTSGQGVLERQLRVDIDEPTRHDKVFGNPIGVGAFKGLDLVLGNPVELLAGNVVVDFRRTLAVRAVGAAQIRRVRNPRGTLFPRSAAEATSFGTGAIELAGAALRTVSEAAALTVTLTMGPVTKRLTVAITKARARIPVTTRTITKRLTITITLTTRPVTKRLTVAITKARARIPITTRTITKRLTVAITKARARIPITTRTITKRLTVAITKARARIPITTRTITKRLTVAITKARARIPITTRTITKRLTVAITKARARIPITTRTITKRLTVAITKARARIPITTRTITKRLTVAITKARARIPITTRTITKTTALTIASRLTITITTGSAGSAITVLPGTESSRLAPGIVVGAERAAIATATTEVAAVAAVVLSHDGFLLL
ncbi:hypothetical protein GCM10023063_28770 [Arthrobacter methylotrophus]